MITLSKIAKLAHVSVSTVSKAFSMSNEISSDTREMIFDIAKQYGVFKKYYRAKYPKHVIAVICPEFEGRDYSSALTVLQKYLSAFNCEICVASTNFSAKIAKELLEYYNNYATVDGIIYIDPYGTFSYASEIPVATISIAHTNAQISIKMAAKNAYENAILHLKTSGIQKIGILSDPLTANTLEMLSSLCQQAGYNPQNIFGSLSDARFNEGGYKAMKQLFERNEIPEAILCVYDNIAIGAMRCILDRGLSVPGDILVIGKSNNLETAYLNPPLASIDTHLEEACEKAASTLLAHLNGKSYEKKITVEAEFILRKSAQK